MPDITQDELEALRRAFAPLVGLRISWLSIPGRALAGFEPSQIAVIVNTLLDAILPQIEFLASDKENAAKLAGVGLSKAPGVIGQRETYPDYVHVSGRRVELKGLFVDNPSLALRRPPTDREPSACLKENITMDIIDPVNDALLVAAVQLRPDQKGQCSPYITDIGVFSMVECVRARDKRLADSGGRWISGVPKVVKKASIGKFKKGRRLQNSDFEKDTNFGKLKRIPYAPLQDFMRKHGAI
jgi:hypothetical protein